MEEVPYGVYVWETEGGSWVADSDGNFLSVACMKDDTKKIKALTDAARYYGVETGHPVYLSGHRKVTDEEFEEQKLRSSWGLIPDPLDAPAFRDEAEGRNARK